MSAQFFPNLPLAKYKNLNSDKKFRPVGRVLHTCLVVVVVVMVTHPKAEQTNDGIWTDINTVDSISTGSFDMFSYTYFDQRVTFHHSDKFHSKMSKISLK